MRRRGLPFAWGRRLAGCGSVFGVDLFEVLEDALVVSLELDLIINVDGWRRQRRERRQVGRVVVGHGLQWRGARCCVAAVDGFGGCGSGGLQESFQRMGGRSKAGGMTALHSRLVLGRNWTLN